MEGEKGLQAYIFIFIAERISARLIIQDLFS